MGRKEGWQRPVMILHEAYWSAPGRRWGRSQLVVAVETEWRAQIWERVSCMKLIKFGAQLFRATDVGGRGVYADLFRRLDKIEAHIGGWEVDENKLWVQFWSSSLSLALRSWKLECVAWKREDWNRNANLGIVNLEKAENRKSLTLSLGSIMAPIYWPFCITLTKKKCPSFKYRSP